MSQAPHQTKFRWTENLTCRFIQLRKENGKLFTGQKYSAQAGWECILQQMREEFPTIMANVHYRVLKKKWSNLLQQYKPILLLCICYSDLLKELKNPVHGDRNKADDVSWPFYSAIDEVLGHGGGTPNNEEYIDPHEFLCVSVTPEEPTSSVDALPAESNPEIERRTALLSDQRLRPFDGDLSLIQMQEFTNRQLTRQPVKAQRRKRDARGSLISRLPRATELSIEKVTSEADCSKDLPKEAARNNVLVVVGSTRKKGQPGTARNVDEERPRKLRRARVPCHEDHESRIDRRIEEIFEYTKRRDEENRCMMARIMHAVETIANKL